MSTGGGSTGIAPSWLIVRGRRPHPPPLDSQQAKKSLAKCTGVGARRRTSRDLIDERFEIAPDMGIVDVLSDLIVW